MNWRTIGCVLFAVWSGSAPAAESDVLIFKDGAQEIGTVLSRDPDGAVRWQQQGRSSKVLIQAKDIAQVILARDKAAVSAPAPAPAPAPTPSAALPAPAEPRP